MKRGNPHLLQPQAWPLTLARRGQGRGHRSFPKESAAGLHCETRDRWPSQQNLAYVPPGTSPLTVSISKSAFRSTASAALVARAAGVVTTSGVPAASPSNARSSRVTTSWRPWSVRWPYVSAVSASFGQVVAAEPAHSLVRRPVGLQQAGYRRCASALRVTRLIGLRPRSAILSVCTMIARSRYVDWCPT